MPLPTDARILPALGDDFGDALDAGLAALHLPLAPDVRRAIEAQARLLLAWGAAINLSALREPDDIALRHVVDSLSAVPLIRERFGAPHDGAPQRGLSVLDLGSGAGYPGLPVALTLPAGRITLLDSIAKKAAFLEVASRVAIAELPAGSRPPIASVLPLRAEAVAASQDRATWDVVLVRAVGSLAEIFELGLPLLAQGGLLVCWKRDPIDRATLSQELADAQRLVGSLGGGTPEVVHVPVPGLRDHRLVLVTKRGPTPARFPRPPAERRRLLR